MAGAADAGLPTSGSVGERMGSRVRSSLFDNGRRLVLQLVPVCGLVQNCAGKKETPTESPPGSLGSPWLRPSLEHTGRMGTGRHILEG